jgi:hypothetical protein
MKSEVENWLYRGGGCPSDRAIADAVKRKIDEWRAHRDNGMDVLASAAMDELTHLLEAIKTLI